MNQCMNVFTAKTQRRKDTCRYYLKLLSASLRLCAFAVEYLKTNSLHKTFLLTNRLSAKLLMSLFLFLLGTFTQAQEIDLLLKNGYVIDPANNINARLDVAIADGKIVKVATGIATDKAKKVVDVTGLYVCPGFIDIHTHVFVGSKPETFADGSLSLSPDDFTFRAGVTTVVDAGTSGWRNFPVFKDQVIDRSKTRILAFLNISGAGMSGKQTQGDINDMDPAKASETIQPI
jgi:dihydroorotase